jgi:hypothetical protein
MTIDSYPTLTDKNNHFDSVNIDSKNDLDNLIAQWTTLGNEKHFIFRGVTEAKYKLFNSAQRYWNGEELDRLGRSYQDFIQTEIDRAKAFQNNLLIKFYNAFGHTAYDLSILSFLQHYKAPTPLLDFTYNFDCALFFGTDGLTHYPTSDIGNYFSVYAIDTRSRDFISFISHLDSSINQIDDILNRNQQYQIDTTEILNNIAQLKYNYFHSLRLFYLPGYIPGGIPFAIANRPNFKLIYNQHNLNVINQEGLFVFNSDPTHPLEDYFTGGFGTGFQSTFQLPKMKCWNIHKSFKEYVVRHLTENRPIPMDKEFVYPQEEFIAESAYKQFKNFK